MAKTWNQSVTKKMQDKGTKCAPKTGGSAPGGKLESAAKRGGSLGKRAQFALNVKNKS